MIIKNISKFLLKILSWSVVGELNQKNTQVVIIAPHTSNWDGFILFLVKFAYSYKAIGLGKKELFKIPLFGKLLFYLGIRPVDRSKKTNLVYDLVRWLKNNKEPISFCLAPEGSRFRREKWRSGFYYIALKANVPVVCVSLDYSSKVVEFSKPFKLAGNIKDDFKCQNKVASSY